MRLRARSAGHGCRPWLEPARRVVQAHGLGNTPAALRASTDLACGYDFFTAGTGLPAIFSLTALSVARLVK
jgi:hypothetical protein